MKFPKGTAKGNKSKSNTASHEVVTGRVDITFPPTKQTGSNRHTIFTVLTINEMETKTFCVIDFGSDT